MSYGDFSSPQAQYMLVNSGNLSNGVDSTEHKFYINCIATVVVRNDWRYIMGENEVEHENVNEFYKGKIYELVAHCDNERWLRAILTFIKELLK